MVSIEEMYNHAISIRNVEVDQFWKRNVFLFGIEGLLLSFFIGSFNFFVNSEYKYLILFFIVFSFIFSFLTFCLVCVNKSWLEYWENTLGEIEEKNNFPVKLFRRVYSKDKRTIIKIKNLFRSSKSLMVMISILFIVLWFFIMLCVL